MTGQDENTTHCEASMTATTQKHGYPDKTQKNNQRLFTSKVYQERYQEILLDPFPNNGKISHSHQEGAAREFQVLPHLKRQQSARVTTRTHAKDDNYEGTPRLYGTRVTGAPSPAEPQGARVTTRTFESLGCSLTSEKNQSNIRVNTRRKIPRLST